MAQATFSVRMEENLKIQFEELCNDFGMNMTTAINIFARAVVNQKKIPFEITSSSSNNLIRENAIKTYLEMRTQAANMFPNGMSLDEINAEISKVRQEEVEE